ncbi:MAG: MaoC family dehydratase [Proteobacteria bacterium]|nr:MaoC family dehydratase [Pseudomonadota bacterium]
MVEEKHWKIGEVVTGAIKTVRNFPHESPLHGDRAAKNAGFKGGLILNEYHFTQISQMLLECFGIQWLYHGEIEIKYLAPLFEKDTFVPKAKVLGENPSGSGRVELEIWCENQNGERLAIGKASCLAERRGIT